MSTQVFGTFSEAADHFVEVAWWLEGSDAPLVTVLVNAAAALDQRMSGALLAEFRQAYVLLRRRAPAEETAKDSLDAWLETL